MSGLADSLPEVFEKLGRIQARRMFGGHGVYHDGRMFGLVTGDTLYFKVDAESASHFDAQNLPAFEYLRGEKTVRLSFRQAPAEVFEDRDEAARWGRIAWEAAVRSGKPSRAKKKKAPDR